MPIVLFSIEGQDNSASAFQRATSGLNSVGGAADRAAGQSATFDKALSAAAASSARVETAAARVQAATLRQAQAMNQAADASARYRSAMDALNSGTGDTATLAARAASAFDSLTSAQIRAADSGIRVADSYTRLASAQDLATRNEQKLRSIMDAPLKSAGTGGGNAGGGSRAGSYLLAGIGYQAAYGAYSQVSQSLGRDITYSQTLGSTAAETGLTPTEAARLSSLTRGYAGKGGEPYNANTLLTGEYSLASLGVGQKTSDMPQAVFQISQIAAKMSAASNAPDISSATDTLTSVLADFNLNTKDVVSNAARIANQLQVGVKLGKAELPDFAAQVAIPATQASQLGVSTGDVFSYLAAESAGGLPTGELGQSMFALLRSSQKATPKQQSVAAGLGIDYNSSFWGTNGIAGGSALIAQRMQAEGLSRPQEATVLQGLFGNQAASKGYGAALAGGLSNISTQVGMASQGGGAVNSAYYASQQYAGAKLADSETKLATAFDNLTTAAIPALTLAADAAAKGLNAIGSLMAGPGGKGGLGESTAGAMQTFANLFNPSSKDFLNPTAARADAANQRQQFHDQQTAQSAQGSLTAPLTIHGMQVIAAAPGSALYAKNQGHPYSPQMYEEYGNAAQKAEFADHAAATQAITAPAIRGGGPTPDHPQLTGGGGPTYYAPGTNTANPDLSAAGRSYDRSYTGPGYTGPMGINSPAYLAATHTGATTSSSNANIGAGLGFGYENLGTAPTAAALALAQSDALNRSMKDLQNTISIQQLNGNAGGTASAQAALLAFETKNAKALKLDPSDLALLRAQNAASLQATTQVINTHPFFQKQQGLGSFEAGEGSTLVRSGGVDPATAEIKVLRTELAAANARADGYLAQIANNTKTSKPQAAGRTAAQSGRRGVSGP